MEFVISQFKISKSFFLMILSLLIGCQESARESKRKFEAINLQKGKDNSIEKNQNVKNPNSKKAINKLEAERPRELYLLPTRIRRLSKNELRNILIDSKLIESETEGFKEDPELEGYKNQFNLLNFDLPYFKATRTTIKSIANRLSTSKYFECPDEQCLREKLKNLFTRLSTSELKNERLDEIMTYYKHKKSQLNKSSALSKVLEIIMLNPRVLYRQEIGNSSGEMEEPSEVLRQLSFLLWESVPSLEKTEKLIKNSRISKDTVNRIAKSMIKNEKAERAFEAFIRQWLKITPISRLNNKESQDKHNLNFEELKFDFDKEFSKFVRFHFRKGNFESLMSTDKGFVNKSMAKFYNLDSIPAKSEQIKLPPERKGILSLPMFLASHSKSKDSHPIKRGILVRERLFCTKIIPPDASTPLEFPDTNLDKSIRERFIEHRENKNCASCHELMDDLGFAFEGFDAMGVFRTKDKLNHFIDTSGKIAMTKTTNEAFENFSDFAQKLGRSQDVKRCFVQNYISYLAGDLIEDSGIGSKLIDEFYAEFEKSNFDMKSIPTHFVNTELFWNRKPK